MTRPGDELRRPYEAAWSIEDLLRMAAVLLPRAGPLASLNEQARNDWCDRRAAWVRQYASLSSERGRTE